MSYGQRYPRHSRVFREGDGGVVLGVSLLVLAALKCIPRNIMIALTVITMDRNTIVVLLRLTRIAIFKMQILRGGKI